jgi:nucleotide-binding universal stress UspA family protein
LWCGIRKKGKRELMEQYSPKTILLATDGSQDGGLAVAAAVDLSKRTGAKLHAAHAWVPLPHFAHPSLVSARYHPPYEEGARRILDEQVGRIEQAGGTVLGAHLVEGRPADAILDLAERIGADLIVIGSRGLSSVKRLLVGSVSLGVVHHADRPVLVVRGGSWPPVRVVIGEDLSEDAHGAERVGIALGKLLKAETLLAHAYEGMPPHPETLPRDDRELYEAMVEKYLARAEPALEARAAELEDAYGLRPRLRILEGESATALSEVAEEGGGTGLLVVGSRGLGTGGRMLLGSVSTKVLMAARGPVLVCPREERDEGGRRA